MMKEKVSNGGGTFCRRKEAFQDERELRCLGGFGMITRAEEPGVKVSEGSPDRPSPSTGSLALGQPHQGACGALAPFALESLSP